MDNVTRNFYRGKLELISGEVNICQKKMRINHDRFNIQSGSVTSLKQPLTGASLDSVVECNSCSKGSVYNKVTFPYFVGDKLVANRVIKMARPQKVDTAARTSVLLLILTQIFAAMLTTVTLWFE